MEGEEQNVIYIKVVVNGREEMRVLRRVVYMVKSRGTRTEPWRTLQYATRTHQKMR